MSILNRFKKPDIKEPEAAEVKKPTAAQIKTDFIESLKQNGHSKKELKQLYREANAQIVVEATRMLVYRSIPEDLIPANSFDKKYNGRWMHFLGMDKDNKFWPLEENIPTPEPNRAPTDHFMALNCGPEILEFYGESLPAMAKIKIGLFIGALIGIIFIIFLMVTAAG